MDDHVKFCTSTNYVWISTCIFGRSRDIMGAHKLYVDVRATAFLGVHIILWTYTNCVCGRPNMEPTSRILGAHNIASGAPRYCNGLPHFCLGSHELLWTPKTAQQWESTQIVARPRLLWAPNDDGLLGTQLCNIARPHEILGDHHALMGVHHVILGSPRNNLGVLVANMGNHHAFWATMTRYCGHPDFASGVTRLFVSVHENVMDVHEMYMVDHGKCVEFHAFSWTPT